MKAKFSEFIEHIDKYLKITKKPFVIAVSGGSGSGKTFIAKLIAEKLDGKVFSMDDYIRAEHIQSNNNWDVPEAWDLKLVKEHLIQLKNGKEIDKPVYDFMNSKRNNIVKFKTEIIVIEGNFALIDDFKNMVDLKIFVDASEEIRLNRRLERDSIKRGQTKEKIFEMWKNYIQPMYLEHIEPQKKEADLIIENN